jgi:hypothetical protein
MAHARAVGDDDFVALVLPQAVTVSVLEIKDLARAKRLLGEVRPIRRITGDGHLLPDAIGLEAVFNCFRVQQQIWNEPPEYAGMAAKPGCCG